MLLNIYIFLYIAVIVLGGVTLPLIWILEQKEHDRRHKALMMFIASIFVYMIADFVTYYFLEEPISGNAIFAMITISDILYCFVTLAWMYLIEVIIGAEQIMKLRYLTMITLAYAVLSQILSISIGRYSTYSLYLVVDDGFQNVLLQCINLAYVLVVIGICLWNAFYAVKTTADKKFLWLKLLMIFSLVVYMCYIALWDYSTWFKSEEKLIDIYGLDPLLLMYAFLSSAVIFYFIKKDPLKLSGAQVGSEEAILLIVKKYSLSNREKDVLELLNMGQSNLQIAGELSISENTVKRHVNNIFKKTEVQSRHELISKVANVQKIDL